jgi:hypothetical protein
MIAKLLGGFISIIIGLYVVKLVTEEVKKMPQNPNTPLYNTLIDFLPLFFVVIIVMTALKIIIDTFHECGLDLITADIDEPKPKKLNNKQTYEEFVDERLRIEKKL